MFYQLSGSGYVSDSQLWFNPDDLEIVEVLDMGDAAGVEGLWEVFRGDIYINEERVKQALESVGLFKEEVEPAPPRRGRKSWDPRPWRADPKPGYLFWMPEMPEGYAILEAFKEWEEAQSIEALPAPRRGDALYAAELVFQYYGFDGGPREVVAIVKDGSAAEKEVPTARVTKNPDGAIKKTLERWGVLGRQRSR